MPVTGSEWSDEDYSRHALMGRMTEAFNATEFMLHVLVWRAMGSEVEAPIRHALTERKSATDLVRDIRRLCDVGAYGSSASNLKVLLTRFERLADRRNLYVHGWWEERSIPGESPRQVVAKLREWIRGGDDVLLPYDSSDLNRLIADLDRIVDEFMDAFERSFDT